AACSTRTLSLREARSRTCSRPTAPSRITARFTPVWSAPSWCSRPCHPLRAGALAANGAPGHATHDRDELFERTGGQPLPRGPHPRRVIGSSNPERQVDGAIRYFCDARAIERHRLRASRERQAVRQRDQLIDGHAAPSCFVLAILAPGGILSA